MTRQQLTDAVILALVHNGGKASIIQVSKYIWDNYENELRAAGDIFYTWQYEVRWSAKQLRDMGLMKQVKDSKKGIWELVK